ncbi:MAG TPA: tetratricopeptide repeat protein [Verrucomicrobiae bacterium]|nr:tetratricopeptide repeat protein [Verrucomicrobiae bacterium]
MSRPDKRILLVGWDAADWQIIRPLLEAGALPNLLRLVEAGVSGNLASLRPVISPLLWNSLATGRLADKHGILGVSQVDSDERIQPFSSSSRRVKALWNVLSDQGWRCHVVNWPASHPAEQINGVAVSEAFIRRLHEGDVSPSLPARGVFPDVHAAALAQCAVQPQDIDAATIRLFVPDFANIDQERDPHLIQLARMLAECFTIHAITTHLMEAEPWDLTAAFYPTLNNISREFMRFRAPRLERVSELEFQFYRDVVDGAYRLHDLLLGRLLHLAGTDATVVLCSASGYQSGKLRLSNGAGQVQTQTLEHRPVGILVVKGPGIRQDNLAHGAGVLDIVPTVLTMAELPIGRDLNGRALVSIFHMPRQPVFIETPDTPDERGAGETESQDTDSESSVPPAAFKGSIYAAAVQAENDWALAMVFLFSGRVRKAVPLLEQIYQAFPLRFDFGLMLAECYLRVGLIDEGSTIVQHIAAAIPRDVRAKMLLATIHNARGHFKEALNLLLAIEVSLANASPDFCNLLGLVYQRLDRPVEAMRCYERAVELEPDSAVAWLGKARCCLKVGDYENGTAAALEALGREYALAEAHLVLGICLVRLRNPEGAISALETSLRFNPHRPVTIKFLLDLYSAREGFEADVLRLQALMKQQLLAGARRRKLSQETHREMKARAAERVLQTGTENSDESPDSVVLRPAQPRDIAAVVALLPGAIRKPSHSLIEVVETGRAMPMAGCGSLVFADGGQAYVEWAFTREISGDHLLIILLRKLCDEAQRCGATRVITARAFEAGSAEAAALLQARFSVSNVYQWYETDLSAGARLFDRAQQQLVRSGKIPRAARVVPLVEAPAIAVRSLIASEVGGSVAIEQFEETFSQRHSWIVMEGSRVVGATLMILTNGTPQAPWMAIDPAYRNSWVYVLLMRAAHNSLIAAGFMEVQFKTNAEKHPGMRNFAKRLRADELRSESHFIRELRTPR